MTLWNLEMVSVASPESPKVCGGGFDSPMYAITARAGTAISAAKCAEFVRDRGYHQRAEQEALNEALNEAGDRSGSGGDHHPNFEGEMEVCTKRHSKRKLQCASVPLALIVCRFIVAVCAMQ